VVLVDEIQEPAQQLRALLLGHAVDVLDVATNGEDALPASDRVCTDDGMNRLELRADILGCTTGLVVQLEASLLGNPPETRLLKSHGKTLEELLVRLADTIVDLVARRPEGI